MNIFRHELKTYQKTTIIWTSSLTALAVFYLMAFPAFTSDIELTRKLFEGFPPAVLAALGINLNTFFSILGFYSYIFTFVVLAGAVQAMNLGAGVISKEDRLKTSDFLLTKPVTRVRVMTAKILAVLSLLVITNAVYMSAAAITARAVATEPFSMEILLMISASLFLVQIMFLVLGIFFAVIIPKIKSVVSFSLPTVFAFFIISTLGAVLGEDQVRYFTPFRYYDAAYIMTKSSYEARFIILEILLLIILCVASYIIYIKKDIRAVT